jgi:hypothetical protein
VELVYKAHAQVRPGARDSVEAAREAGVGVIRQELIEEFSGGRGSKHHFRRTGAGVVHSAMSRVKHTHGANQTK